MKNGIIIENGVPTYYENDKPVHKGIVKDGNDIYYFGKGGEAVSGKKYVHTSMTHHIVRHGTYKFGNDFKMDQKYYKAPRKKASLKTRFKRLFKSSSGHSQKSKMKPGAVAAIVIAATLAVTFFFLSVTVGNHSADNSAESNSPKSSDLLNIHVPEIDEEVWLVNNTAKKIYTENADVSVLKKIYPYQPFHFDYSITCSDLTKAKDIIANLYLSESPSMANFVKYEAEPSASEITIDNLKVATTYYYRFDVSLADEKHSFYGSFKTAASHRLLSIPDLQKTRDVGGRKTLDNKTIKQNMIIRGSELDGLTENDYYLQDDYIEYVRNTFGFKLDLDLRDPIISYSGYTSRLGKDVKHQFFDAPMYSAALSEENRPIIKSIFSFLADKSNYPIYLHCAYGIDRTGTIVYLLDAILGLSEKEMILEYGLSNNNTDALKPFRTALEIYKGDTINEKVENFLIEAVGVTPEEIASIREIMLTD